MLPNADLLPGLPSQLVGLAELVEGRLRLVRHGANSGAKG